MKRLALVLLLGVISCGGVETDSNRLVEESDSAGIRVITVRDAALAALPFHAPGERPLWSIGQADGPPEQLLYRVPSVVPTRAGIAVLNAGSGEVRLYGQDGTLLRTQGRRGDGPGEYRSPSRLLLLPEDSLAVWDPGSQRISILDPDLGFVRSSSPTTGEILSDVVGVFEDGSLALASRANPEPGDGPRQMAYTEYLLGPLGASEWVTVGPLPWMEVLIETLADGATRITFPLAGAQTVSAVQGRDLWIGTGTAPRVERYGRDGVLSHILRWDQERVPVTEEVKEKSLRAALEQTPNEDQRMGVQRLFETRPFAEFLPFYSQLHVGADGRLWVRSDDLDVPDEARWVVFEADGRPSMRVRLPVRLTLFWSQGSQIIVRDRDDLEVVYVRAFRLEQTSDSGSE